ncbi:Thiol protease SEN102 [Linum perenne]
MAPNKRKGKEVAKQAQKKQGQSSSPHPSDLESDAPLDINHSQYIVSKARRQGTNNTCWAIATAVTVEAFVNKFGKVRQYLSASPQELIDNELSFEEKKKNDPISRLYRVWRRIKVHGVALEEDYEFEEKPGKPKRLATGLTRLYIDNHDELKKIQEKEILKLLARHPVVATLKAYLSFEKFLKTDKVYVPKPEERNTVVEHAVVLIGYGTEKDENDDDIHFFRCMNSHGESWGIGGVGKIIRSISSNEKCPFTSITYPTAPCLAKRVGV